MLKRVVVLVLTPTLWYNVSPVLRVEEVVWEQVEGESSKVEAQGSCSREAPRGLEQDQGTVREREPEDAAALVARQ